MLFRYMEELYLESIRSEEKCADWAYSAINWYIETCRASAAWEKALQKANPRKLLHYMLSGEDKSDDVMVTRATKYLKRYCGLTE